MLTALITRLVLFSRLKARTIALAALIATLGLGAFVATHFAINTNVNKLLSDDLAWRQREKEMERAFPESADRLVVVIDGKNPDAAENAAALLSEKMGLESAFFHNVTRPDNIPYFKKNGFLFLSTDELNGILESLIKAQPLLGSLAKDPSLRGLFGTLDLALGGLARGDVEGEKLDMPLGVLADSVQAVLDGKSEPLPLRTLMAGEHPKLRDTRKFILTQPVLDYGDLSPGNKASQKVRDLAKDLNLTPDNGVTVRLTGSVALGDEEFASVADGAASATIISFLLVIVILFLALRSFRLILPIFLTLIVGLVATTAFAMAAVGSLNLISVAFAVMFVGIAVDFGIQFGVRYRDQKHREPDEAKALAATAKAIALPLALAAGSTAVGFLAFLPTDYKGVAELGLIAGAGMLIAFALNITLLPALLTLLHTPPEPEAVGFAWAAPADRFLLTHRKPVLAVVAIIAVLALALSSQIRFDFDPMNLRDPHTESVATMFDVMQDPDATPYTVSILAPSMDESMLLAQKIDKLPEVDHTITLASFVPSNQDDKLALIADARFLLENTVNPVATDPAPSAQENRAALQKVVEDLTALPAQSPSTLRLKGALEALLEKNDDKLLTALDASLVQPAVGQLGFVRDLLGASSLSIQSITPDLKTSWITPDRRAKIEVYPKGNARDPKVLTAFTKAVQSVAPEATGPAISIQESGATITRSFTHAGIFATLAIALLSWLVLRSLADVLRLLAPLFLAGILTLATMVILPLPLTFANIIALPLLLSLGVSYAIYFIVAWRRGSSEPLQSSVGRAVLFSASTTLVAFASLSFSAHPGTRGMGILLTISLLYSLVCTFFVLPALLGRSRMS